MAERMLRVILLGYDNAIVAERIVAIVQPLANPVRRLKDEARRHNKLVDATNGHRTRSVIVTDSDHVVLSSLEPRRLIQRLTPPPVGGLAERARGLKGRQPPVGPTGSGVTSSDEVAE